MDNNSRIGLRIMLIAVIGGTAFLLYLALNVILASINGARLDELQHHHYPIIEDLRLLKQDLQSIREGFAATVGMGDPLLLEDTASLVLEVERRLERLLSRDERLKVPLQVLQQGFATYAANATALAQQMLDHPDDLPRYHEQMTASLQTLERLQRQIQQLQVQRQRMYGELLDQTHRAVNQANLWGALLGVAVIIGLVLLAWTISRRVVRDIEKSDRLKDEFLAAISHELRTPMNGIIGALSLLRTTGVDEEQKNWIEIASRSANGMMMSIDDLLQFSELAAGQEQLLTSVFMLRPGLERLLESQRPEFTDKNLLFEFHGGAILDRLIVSHEAKILYVVRHLLSNALKFTERGGVLLSVSQASQTSEEGDATIRVLVQDSGPGIAPEHLQSVFRPFRQQDGSFSRRHQGMGIGLATCHAIAHLLKGSLQVRNRPSGGLEVEFLFPVKFADLARETRVEKGRVQPQRSKVVLVVEDNAANLAVLKGHLQQLGYHVLSARHGRQAVDLMQSRLVSLVIMDCQMPVMDGFEAARAIRKLPSPLCDTPIIALTANVMDMDRQRCRDAGMNAFVQKPVALPDLQRVIASVEVSETA
jgi:signal transduction histidine kinase/CheY-like chemotaxis protein